ncbi:MAG: hypothetical protein EXR75_08560 [Myxococcales bacterium]|nr:hypothetical protein [Myxococcales bacterium]
MSAGLGEELGSLDDALVRRLATRGFDSERLCAWALGLGGDRVERNRLRGVLEPLAPHELAKLPPVDSAAYAEFSQTGRAALEAGQLAICVLAGGMATRMGGVVKALVEATEGITFLALRAAELALLAERHGTAPPMWLMTSEATHALICAELARHHAEAPLAAFEQLVSLRLTPDGALFRKDGEVSVYATGHGDLPDALRASGLLDAFLARGGRWVWISNLDNLGASVDMAILGHHIASGAEVTAELVVKHAGDVGGGPVRCDGRPIIAEHFRLPADFPHERVPVFNTNTFLIDARALRDLAMAWTYVEVRKQVGGREAVQFERLLGELTSALTTSMLEVSRQGPTSRFLPVKTEADRKGLEADVMRLARERRLL